MISYFLFKILEQNSKIPESRDNLEILDFHTFYINLVTVRLQDFLKGLRPCGYPRSLSGNPTRHGVYKHRGLRPCRETTRRGGRCVRRGDARDGFEADREAELLGSRASKATRDLGVGLDLRGHARGGNGSSSTFFGDPAHVRTAEVLDPGHARGLFGFEFRSKATRDLGVRSFLGAKRLRDDRKHRDRRASDRRPFEGHVVVGDADDLDARFRDAADDREVGLGEDGEMLADNANVVIPGRAVAAVEADRETERGEEGVDVRHVGLEVDKLTTKLLGEATETEEVHVCATSQCRKAVEEARIVDGGPVGESGTRAMVGVSDERHCSWTYNIVYFLP
jgi:hypothetical protein